MYKSGYLKENDLKHFEIQNLPLIPPVFPKPI